MRGNATSHGLHSSASARQKELFDTLTGSFATAGDVPSVFTWYIRWDCSGWSFRRFWWAWPRIPPSTGWAPRQSGHCRRPGRYPAGFRRNRRPNKIDVAISGFTYDEDRAASYLFSESYYDDGEGDQVLVYNKSKADQFQSLEDLNKPEVKVGAQNGSLQQSLVEDQLPNCNLIAFEDINNAFTALNSGQYDAIAIASTAADTILTADVNKDIMKSNFKFEVEDSALYVIMKKGNTDLKAKVDVVCKESAASLYETWIKNAEALYQSLGDNAGELIPEEEEDEIQ